MFRLLKAACQLFFSHSAWSSTDSAATGSMHAAMHAGEKAQHKPLCSSHQCCFFSGKAGFAAAATGSVAAARC
jgi:hypothetical protein